MKNIIFLLLATIALFSCSNNQSESGENKSADSTVTTPAPVNKDSLIKSLSDQVLTTLQAKDYKKLAEFVHPVLGVRFTPYAFIDTTADVKLSATALTEQFSKTGKLSWGSYDGSGEPIMLSIEEYFKQFVYSADFLNATQKSLNVVIGGGNTTNNIASIYAGCDFTENYFPAIDKKFEGIDWCSLRLVFKELSGKYYLVGVIHDQWTI